MKKVKTIVFSVAVVLVSLFLCSAGCQNAADSGSSGGGQQGAAYSFDENSKTLTIHHTKYLYSIPDSIREVVVKAVIENGVRSIDYTYFENSKKLVSVSIPSSVTYIGHSTFNGCESLRSVSIAKKDFLEMLAHEKDKDVQKFLADAKSKAKDTATKKLFDEFLSNAVDALPYAKLTVTAVKAFCAVTSK